MKPEQSKMIYVVSGRAGRYDCTSEWQVRAYESEQDAMACVERLNAWCNERGWGKDRTKPEWTWEHRDLAQRPPDDPFFYLVRGDDTTYTYDFLELVERSRAD